MRSEKSREHNKIYQREYYRRNRVAICAKKKEMMRRLRKERPDTYRAICLRYSSSRREKLFAKYGDRCAICGFADKRALSLDHVNNDGAEQRRLLGESRIKTMAAMEYRPDQFRILCMNCQFIERQSINQHKKPHVVARILTVEEGQ